MYQLNECLIEELSDLKIKLSLKEEEIQRLKTENLELREEKTDIDYQTKLLFKGGLANSKLTANNITKTDNTFYKVIFIKFREATVSQCPQLLLLTFPCLVLWTSISSKKKKLTWKTNL